MLQENGEVCSLSPGEGGEYFVSPRNTAVILISMSIRCDIVLAKQGESIHNQKYASDTGSNDSTWKYVSKLAYNWSFGKTEKNTLSHIFSYSITYLLILKLEIPFKLIQTLSKNN